MQSPNFPIAAKNMAALQRMAALTLLGVMVVGAWQSFSAAKNIDAQTLPISLSDFREGRTTAALEKQIDQKLPVRNALIATANSLRFLLTNGAGEQVRVGKQGWLFLTDELRFDANGHTNFKARVDLLDTATRRLDAVGVKLVVALVPDKARVYSEKLSGGQFPEYNHARYQDALSALRARGVIAIDLLAPLTSAAADSEVYYRTDTHWNQAGARIAAQSIAKAVQQLPIQIEDTQFSTTVATDVTERSGDLIRLMGLENTHVFFRPRADFEASSTTIPLSTDSPDALFGDAGVSVVLTGTSYSLRGNFHGYLQQALGAKVLNAAKDGGGFLQAMTDYLKDDSFRLAKPKVIVWEIPERFVRNDLNGEPTWFEDVSLTR
ncbi:MAG: hypothetical protein RIR09_2086 [Pseudomonadota bacterium]|jgi:alginate O-acetyltransferase complex protein AlgJ